MRKFFSVFVLGLLFAGATAYGDVATTQPVGDGSVKGKEVAEETQPEKLIGIDGGVDFTTGYFFRGYRQQADGLIVQPFANLAVNLPTSIGTISPYVGTWNSIHTVQTGTRSPNGWYETDGIAGVNLESGPFTFGVVYTYFYSPDGSFGASQELGATVKFDDSKWIKPISLNPHLGVYRQLDTNSNVANTPPGTYLEVGFEPSYDLKLGGTVLTLSLPTTFGFSLDHYYLESNGSNDPFGYGAVGVKGSLPLGDHLSLNAGVTYLHLFADSVVTANGGERNQFIGTVGLGFSF